ncbi:MAG: DUF4870 domain-containing protein [Ignavibacteriae bacterium]|nr:MAG: DUF4870 domain-containing protein [Ignavibacteriota bacterium]
MNQPTGSYYLKDEEKLMGLFSHLSLFLGGIILPIVFWIINKDKSKFATFHALQALFFHIAYIAVIFVFIFVFAIGGVGISLLAGLGNHSGGGAAGGLFVIIMIAFYAFLFIYIFGCMGYAIYMGIKAYQGELKKYPVIGNMVYNKVYKNY